MIRTLLIFCLFFSQSLLAIEVPIAQDLKQTYEEAGLNTSGQKKIVLILISQPNCSYCAKITEEILNPMLMSGHYDNTTLFSEVMIHTGLKLKDFNGELVSANKFAQRYNARVTPTLLFLNHKGEEVTEKIVGINTIELYGYYVDKSIRIALDKINP